MGVWILHDSDQQGPGMGSTEEAECFIRYLDLCCEAVPVPGLTGRLSARSSHDPRSYDAAGKLQDLYLEFRGHVQCKKCSHDMDFSELEELDDECFMEAMDGEVLTCGYCPGVKREAFP